MSAYLAHLVTIPKLLDVKKGTTLTKFLEICEMPSDDTKYKAFFAEKKKFAWRLNDSVCEQPCVPLTNIMRSSWS